MLEFDYQSYRDLLERVQSTHRNVSLLELPNCSDRTFILRHDVDFSLSAALRMAEVESAIGIRATYCVLLNGTFYNVLAPPNHEIPRRIRELGHEIALHYDAAALGDRPHDALRHQASLLETMSGAPVRVIARHNPGLGGVDPADGLEGFINAYASELMAGTIYLSDSGGAWRDEAAVLSGGPLPDRLYLLIHPIFWDEHAASRNVRLQEVIDTEIADLRQRAAATAAGWSTHPGVIQHDSRTQGFTAAR